MAARRGGRGGDERPDDGAKGDNPRVGTNSYGGPPDECPKL
jgi:hypothetical protein